MNEPTHVELFKMASVVAGVLGYALDGGETTDLAGLLDAFRLQVSDDQATVTIEMSLSGRMTKMVVAPERCRHHDEVALRRMIALVFTRAERLAASTLMLAYERTPRPDTMAAASPPNGSPAAGVLAA